MFHYVDVVNTTKKYPLMDFNDIFSPFTLFSHFIYCIAYCFGKMQFAKKKLCTIFMYLNLMSSFSVLACDISLLCKEEREVYEKTQREVNTQ